MQNVKTIVHRFDAIVNDNYQKILKRLRTLEVLQDSSNQTQHRDSKYSRNNQLQQRDSINGARPKSRSTRLFDFVFEKDLAISRVYKKVVFSGSTSSLLTAENPRTRWSTLSELSIADVVSSLSVLNLAITPGEIYNASQYTTIDIEVGKIASSKNGTGFHPAPNSIPVSLKPQPDVARSLEQLSDQQNIFFCSLDSAWKDRSSITLLKSAFEHLNIPPSPTYESWYRPAFFVFFGILPEGNQLKPKSAMHDWREIYPHEKPLELYYQWREDGRQPVILLSVHQEPFYHRGTRLQSNEFGFMVDGWLLDAELFRLSLTRLSESSNRHLEKRSF